MFAKLHGRVAYQRVDAAELKQYAALVAGPGRSGLRARRLSQDGGAVADRHQRGDRGQGPIGFPQPPRHDRDDRTGDHFGAHSDSGVDEDAPAEIRRRRISLVALNNGASEQPHFTGPRALIARTLGARCGAGVRCGRGVS